MPKLEQKKSKEGTARVQIGLSVPLVTAIEAYRINHHLTKTNAFTILLEIGLKQDETFYKFYNSLLNETK